MSSDANNSHEDSNAPPESQASSSATISVPPESIPIVPTSSALVTALQPAPAPFLRQTVAKPPADHLSTDSAKDSTALPPLEAPRVERPTTLVEYVEATSTNGHAPTDSADLSENIQPPEASMGNKTSHAQIKIDKTLEADVRKDLEHEQEGTIIENLRLCQLYFVLGCFGLPWLHFITVIYHFKELFGGKIFRVRKYILMSLVVGLIESFIWILWFVVFQLSSNSHLKILGILSGSSALVGKLVR